MSDSHHNHCHDRHASPAENVASTIEVLLSLASTTIRGAASMARTVYDDLIWGRDECGGHGHHACDCCCHTYSYECRPWSEHHSHCCD